MKIMLIVGIFALLPICRSSGMQLVLDLFKAGSINAIQNIKKGKTNITISKQGQEKI